MYLVLHVISVLIFTNFRTNMWKRAKIDNSCKWVGFLMPSMASDLPLNYQQMSYKVLFFCLGSKGCLPSMPQSFAQFWHIRSPSMKHQLTPYSLTKYLILVRLFTLDMESKLKNATNTHIVFKHPQHPFSLQSSL